MLVTKQFMDPIDFFFPTDHWPVYSCYSVLSCNFSNLFTNV